jgi:hypothetical protein
MTRPAAWLRSISDGAVAVRDDAAIGIDGDDAAANDQIGDLL